MSQPSNTLPDRLVRQLEGRCRFRRCPDSAKDDSDFCSAHHAQVLGQKSASARRRRGKLRKAKRCAVCGGPSRLHYRCRRCLRAQRESDQRRTNRHSVDSQSEAPLDSAVIARAETDGYERERYRGGRGGGANGRGAPNAQQINADIVRDAGYARAEIEKFVKAFLIATSPEVLALSPLQRKEAKRLAAGHAAYASRFLDDIVDRLK